MGDRGGIEHEFGSLADVGNGPLNRLPQEVTSCRLERLVLRSAADVCPYVVGLKKA